MSSGSILKPCASAFYLSSENTFDAGTLAMLSGCEGKLAPDGFFDVDPFTTIILG
jgi:hypothetical protein